MAAELLEPPGLEVLTDTRKIFDAVVIGAGPGGSSAVRELLCSGRSVVQFDAESFPRVKPCAGGLTARSLHCAPYDPAPTLVGRAPAFEFSAWKGPAVRFEQTGSVLQFVYRPHFDNWLVEQNLNHTAFSFHSAEPVESIEWDGLFRVQTKQREVVGRNLVGADGAYSRVNRIFDLARPKGKATAVEVVLPNHRVGGTTERVPCFDFGYLPRGYGWVFPKADHWSVGLYTLAEGLRGVRGKLLQYILEKGLKVSGDPLDSFEAHRYPVGGYRLRRPSCPVYLVGDAAGLAEAIVGEGIYYALESGRLAGRAIASHSEPSDGLRWYYRKLRRGLLIDSYLSWRIAGVFYRDPSKWIRRLASPFLWRPFVEGYRRGASLGRCVGFAPFLLLLSLFSGSSIRTVSPPETRLDR